MPGKLWNYCGKKVSLNSKDKISIALSILCNILSNFQVFFEVAYFRNHFSGFGLTSFFKFQSHLLFKHKVFTVLNVILPCTRQYCSAGPCLRWPSCRRVLGCSTAACQSSLPQFAAGLPGFQTRWSGRRASGSSNRCSPESGSTGAPWCLFEVLDRHQSHHSGCRLWLRPQQQNGLERKKI